MTDPTTTTHDPHWKGPMTVSTDLPWYRRTLRWGQTNLTEIDPARYDSDWWRSYWARTEVQGVIINAGGIISYYPSRYPLQPRAAFLGERDLYGEIVTAAREDGLTVIARMDSNRADERFFLEHPDWFTRDASGEPYRAGELFVSCINSPYYDEYLPGVLTEIIERSQPDGFADNSWSGLPRTSICFCDHCARRFRERGGEALPTVANWDDPVYRDWIRWNYQRRVDVWDLNNRATQAAGGEHCLWLGMNGGTIEAQARSFRDFKAIGERSPIIMLDHQGRRGGANYGSNSYAGRMIHGLVGWDKLIPESTALYGYGEPTYRLGSKPAAEARLWALQGFASGIQPWWHHISAFHEDRRQYATALPFMRWHSEHQDVLVNRTPVATVGVVWSQENVDFYGRDAVTERVTLPREGVLAALLRARIPYLPVHADHIARDADQFQTLVVPNIGALSDEQCEAIRTFVKAGGGLVISGESSLYTLDGERRDDFALADLIGAHATGHHHGASGRNPSDWEVWAKHTYLRMPTNAASATTGPKDPGPLLELSSGDRHPVLDGFDDTDLLPFAGRLDVVVPDDDAQVLLTLVPPFPIYPPELSWMRHTTTGVPGLVLNESAGGRVAYLGADIDRCYARDGHPDHGHLLAQLVGWTAGNLAPVTVEGPGAVDVQLYAQGDRLICHLVNVTGSEAPHAPVEDYVPVTLRVGIATEGTPSAVRSLVSGEELVVEIADGRAWVTTTVLDHDVLVLQP